VDLLKNIFKINYFTPIHSNSHQSTNYNLW